MINIERLKNKFLSYVTIASESNKEKAMCDYLKNSLEALGYKVMTYAPLQEYPSTGYTLEVVVPGDASLEGIILAAHVDTVTPGENVQPHIDNDGYVRSLGDTVLGGDDKSGVAALMELLEALKEKEVRHCPLQIFFTIQEEIGCLGSRAIPQEKLAFKQAVVLDSSGDVGRVVISSPGHLKIASTILGKASHAGNNPEGGISAIRVMAKAIENMHLQRIDEETTANIGSFIAEGATNIISEKASITAEIRSRNPEKLRAEERHMYSTLVDACASMGAQLEYEITGESFGYNISPSSSVLKRLERACDKVGCHFFTAASGGGSDANVFNQRGITAVNIATGMEKVHGKEERISLLNLTRCGQLLWYLVTDSCSEN